MDLVRHAQRLGDRHAPWRAGEGDARPRERLPQHNHGIKGETEITHVIELEQQDRLRRLLVAQELMEWREIRPDLGW
ncbi:MAG: hypothetical protein J0H57_12350 [Rhodospirillales bacterium]|nr:hypothetical protein [Rhodospirillales bacterium]